MNQPENFAIVPRPLGSLRKVAPGEKRIPSGMIVDTLTLALHEPTAVARFERIGDYDFCEPDYHQILIWAKALAMRPEVVIDRLHKGKSIKTEWFEGSWEETLIADGKLQKINWDFALLPLREFEWVDGLNTTHLSFWSDPFTTPATRSLSPRLPQLTHLGCPRCGITSLDVLGIPRLRHLEIATNSISQLELSAIPDLEYLDCVGNEICKLNLVDVPGLQLLSCGRNPLDGLDLSGVQRLTELNCYSAGLVTLGLLTHKNLVSLHCGENKLSSLDLSNAAHLKTLACYENKITTLDLSHAHKLEFINCQRNPIAALDIRPLSRLSRLDYDRTRTRLIRRPDQQTPT